MGPPPPRPYDPLVDDDRVRVIGRWGLWELTARETAGGRPVHYEVRFLLGPVTGGVLLMLLTAGVALVSAAAVFRRCPP